MNPPPIRYPLPTLLVATILGVLAWRGEALSRPLRASWAARWERAVAGPEFPKSERPMAVAGLIVRRVLLRRDGIPASETPGGPVAETIRFRMLADVFDVWPPSGMPTHYRIGNRRPIGWVVATDVLPWDTRLVVRAPSGRLALSESPAGASGSAIEVGEAPMPVLAWESGAVRVAAWEPGRAWGDVAWMGWAREVEVPASHWGVLLSREELLTLLRRSLGEDDPKGLRLRAILGRLGEDRPLSAEDIAAARGALPAVAFDGGGKGSAEALARINEQWKPDAGWAGLSFMAVPLEALP